MSRETIKLGILTATPGQIKGREYVDNDEIDRIAEKVLEFIRPEGLLICQVKDVMERVCMLVDLERLM